MNNPLKYTDPSGRYVSLYGIDFTNTPSWLIAEMLTSACNQTQTETKAIVSAWVNACENAPAETQKMIDSHTTYIVQFGDTNANLDSILDVRSDTITINSSYLGDDSWWTGISLLPVIYGAADNFLTIPQQVKITSDWINERVSQLPNNKAVTTVALAIGIPLTLAAGGLSIAGFFPGLAFGEVNEAITIPLTGLGISLTIYGWNTLAGDEYKLYDGYFSMP